MDRVYGREYAMLYLLMELNNRNDHAGLQRVMEQIREMEAAAQASGAGQGNASGNMPE